MAPTEQDSTHCRYCAVPLVWEPEKPIDRDDSNWVYRNLESERGDGTIVLGFGPANVSGNTVQELQCAPQIPVKPCRLFIPSEISSCFLVRDIRIGMKSQFASSAPIIATRFSEREPGNRMSFDACMPGQIIVISVHNISAMSLNFAAALDCQHLDSALYRDKL